MSCLPLEDELQMTPVESLRAFLLAYLDHADVFAVLDSPLDEAVERHLTSALSGNLVAINLTSAEDKRQAWMDYYCSHEKDGRRYAVPAPDNFAQSWTLGRCWEMLTAYERQHGIMYDQVLRVRPDVLIPEALPSPAYRFLSSPKAETEEEGEEEVPTICADPAGGDWDQCLRECPAVEAVG
eukprot:4809794-Prymnesium_polylepis.1